MARHTTTAQRVAAGGLRHRCATPQGARLNRDPPSFVELAQEAVRWLSRAIVELDEDSPDAAAALVDGLGRMLALHVFAEVAREPTDELTA